MRLPAVDRFGKIKHDAALFRFSMMKTLATVLSPGRGDVCSADVPFGNGPTKHRPHASVPARSGGANMDEAVVAVIDAFRNLTAEQQAQAYVEIDALWKEQPLGNGLVPDHEP